MLSFTSALESHQQEVDFDLVVGNALIIKKGESPSVTLKTCS